MTRAPWEDDPIIAPARPGVQAQPAPWEADPIIAPAPAQPAAATQPAQPAVQPQAQPGMPSESQVAGWAQS